MLQLSTSHYLAVSSSMQQHLTDMMETAYIFLRRKNKRETRHSFLFSLNYKTVSRRKKKHLSRDTHQKQPPPSTPPVRANGSK